MKLGSITYYLPDGTTETKDVEVPDNFNEMTDQEFAEYYVREHCKDMYLDIDGDKARIIKIPPLTDRTQ